MSKNFKGAHVSLYPLVSDSLKKKSKVMDLSWATHVALLFFLDANGGNNKVRQQPVPST